MKREKIALILLLVGLFANQQIKAQTTFYSQSNGSWNNTGNWNSAADGSGAWAVAADLTNGLQNFTVQSGDIITVNDSVNIRTLTVSGTFVLGDNTTTRYPKINNGLTIDLGGAITTGAFNTTHILTLTGGLTNNGNLDFRNNSAQAINLLLSGTQTISGTGTFQFNNFQTTSGTITAGVGLNIDGAFIVNTGTTFVAGGNTHSIAGTFTRNGTFTQGTSAIVLDGAMAQSVTTAVTFNDLQITGGGVAVLSAGITVNGNFSVSNNSTVNTDATHTFLKDFTIADGSLFKATDGVVNFNGTTAQNISVGNSNAIFDRVYFDGAGLKTFTGNLTANDYSIIYTAATIVDNTNAWTHTFSNGLLVDGLCNLTSDIVLKGGNYRKGAADNTSPASFQLGNGANIIVDGGIYVVGGDSMMVTGNLSINTGYIVLQYLARTVPIDTVDSRLIGQAGNTMTVAPSANLYIRGKNNFPQGFDSYSFANGSNQIYDAQFNQTIRGGITYGYLHLSNYIKTADGAINIANNLYLNAPNIDSLQFNMGNYSHTISGSIIDNYDATQPTRRCNILSIGTVTLNAPNANQYIYERTIGTYLFNNLSFTNSAPTTTIVKGIFGDVFVSGNFDLSNSSSNELLYMVFDIDDAVIHGGNQFNIGNNVEYRTSGTASFKSSLESFASVDLHANSAVRFDGTDQTIPGGIDYGNLYLYGNGIKTLESNIHIHGNINDMGYTPIFTVPSGGLAINIAGDWLLETNYVNINADGAVTFDGADQMINTTTLPNVSMQGTGTKTLNGNLTILGDLSLSNGIEFDADNRYITISGNWDNNSTATFHQLFGRTTFVGTNAQNIEVLNSATSKFYDLYLDKPTGDTLYLLSDVDVERNTFLTENRGNIHINNHSLSIGGDLYVYDGCKILYSSGGNIKFNGSTEEQLVRNYNENMVYPDIFFSGAAVKRLYDNAYYINGNFNIDHTTVNAEYFMLYIKGNWVNSGGTFTHNSTVIFDGDNQNIDASSFSSVKIAGTGVKKLYGNISLSSWLRIDTLATLDVSPDAGLTNYNISLSGDWFNNEWNASHTTTGIFIPRQGTVTFAGNWGNIYTGDSINASGVGRLGKQFYNVIVNNTDNNYYTRLYPINVANVKTEGNDLRVLNDLTINSGIFYTYWNKLYVGGDFKNTNGSFQMNDYYGQYPTLTLEGTTGNTYEFNPGATQYFRKTVINGGAKYNLTDALAINGANGSLTITNGELNLNHNLVTLTTAAVNCDVIVERNGKISLDSAAILTIPNLRYFRNLGGSINLIGNSNTPAKVTSSGTFYFIQDSGQFAANYYLIENTRGNGLELKAGTLHATNNLSNGMFSGATQTAMLTLDGFDLGTDITVDNVFFNNGPTYNVQRNSGTDTITFSNAKGTYSGEFNDYDPNGLVAWSASTGKTWDGGGDAISWNDADNWEPNGVPDSLTNVYIDHSLYAPIINISVNTAKAYAKSISIEAGSAASKITLNGSPLQIHGDLTIKTGAALEQTNPTDSLILKGNWLSAGTYTCHTAPVIFNLASGTYNLSVADTVYRLFVTGTNGKISLNRNLIVKDSLVLNGGTLATTNYGIYLKGDWTVDGGIFTPGTGTVYFQGTNAAQTQYISGGEFNNIEFGFASPKEILTNITVNGNFTINNNASVDGKTAYIFLKGSWLNDVGESGFDQTGGGTVVFNGTVGVYIGTAAGNKTTLFNNMLIQGSGTKYVRDTIKLNGNLEILTGANLYLNSGTQVLGTGTSNSLLMTGGTLYLLGENNFPQNIENIDLAGGLVDYFSNTDQSIYPTTYYDLRVRRDAIGSNSTKTLLGNIKLLNSLYINDIETLLDVAGYQITLTGGIGFPTDGRQIAWNGGSLIQIGTGWSIDADITNLNNFTKRGSGWITLNHDLDITGNVVFYDETYLNQNTFRMDCSVPGKSFSMGSGGIIYSYIADTTGAAFPLGFDSYSLDENTITYIRGTANQEIFTGVTYGNLYLYDNATRTVEINADLHVNGNFIMSYDGIQLIDNGFDIYLGGLTNQFRNYNSTNTLHFTKAGDQNITAEGIYTTLNFNQIEVSGSGIKEFNETTIDINGQLLINAGATFSTNDNVYFSGDTLSNQGSFIHYGNLFTFDGPKQYVDPGADNDIYGLSISTNDTVSIALHGLDVNNGLFAIANNALLNMGTLTHTIAAVSIDKTGTGNWNVSDANLVFDRNGDQYIPALTAKDITFSTSSVKYLRGNISVDDLTIQPAVRLRSAQVSTNTYNITLTGNWLNQGYTDLYDDTVFFESNAVDSKTITSNGAYFNIVRFNKTNTEHRTYSLSDNMIFYGNMFIGNNATLNLNNNSLTIGNDDANSSVIPYVPAGESLTIETGGELYINGGASLMFNHYDADPSLNVYGKLSVLGSPGINANVTRSGGYDTRGTAITIFSGGTIAAENYHFQYLSHDGLVVQTGANVDDVHNFSNGIWSNIYQYTQHNSPVDNITVIDTFIYLTLNATTVVNPIANVTFNHSATPTVNRHFNVSRSSGLMNVVSFAGAINGSMGASTYEMDPSNLISWPAVSQLIWNGSQSSDWFVAANWTPNGVPSKLTAVRIPLAGNNPVIYKEGAECAKLEITNGILGIEIGADSLAVNGTLLIGSDGVLAIEDNAELKVSGDWNIASDGLFVPKNGLVTFRAPSGSIVIDSRNSVFNHVTFNGGASFFVEGIRNTFNGNMNILEGQLIPNDNNYTYTVKGNFNINGGSFSASSNTGFVDFSGTDQTINNGNFNRVQFSNSGIKTITGTFNTLYENGNALYSTIIVADNAIMTAGAGCSLSIKGNMLLNANATFNDGNQNHSFSGRFWTGTGNYVGNGTVEFNGTTQSIYASKFNNLTLSNQSIGDTYKYLLGDVTLTGNLTLNAYYFDVDAYQITGNGTGTFAQTGTSRIYVRGADNYPKNFATYNPTATTYAFYTGATDQIVRGATYGNLYLNSTTTKTLEDAIVVRGLLYFYDNGVTLNAANNTINIEGSWYNQYSGTFIPGTGEVVFDGTTGNQAIYLGSSVVNPFYKLTVDKTPSTSSVIFSGHDAIIQNDLLVHSGIFTVYTGYTATISGNLTAQNNGTISNSGTYLLNKASGTGTISTNGSTLNHLTINTNGTYKLTDNLIMDGNFTLEHGIFNQNGYRATLGNYYDVVNIYGEYQVTAGGSLLLGDQTTFGVKTGGIIKVVGTSDNYASVLNRTGRYYFNVESGATIHAKYYNFAYMRASGIKVSSGAFIDATNNFSFGTFSNPIAAGTCLNIENDQEIFGEGSRMEGISFPDNPGSGAVNVRKDYATAGQIELFNATGLLSGQNYESDPSNLIFWTGDVVLTWTGAVSSNWFNTANWSSSSGASIIPDQSSTVVIPTGTSNFPIINSDSAFAKAITIDANAFLFVNNPSAAATSLFVMANIQINGTLTMTNATDTLEVYGNWSRGNNGNFIPGNGSVVFSGVGSKSIQNRNSKFNHLNINNNGTVQTLSNLEVLGNFTISTGSFDVTTSNRMLTIGGNYINLGTFTAQSGLVVFNGTGSKTLDPGTSAFYDLEIETGNYSLTNHNLSINRNFDITGGSLALSGLTLYMGDDSGSDDLTINGDLLVGNDGILRLGNNATLNVGAGGLLSLKGTDNHEATVTHRTTGRYSFIIGSGGELQADYYKIDYLNATGLWFQSGSVLAKDTFNLSNGSFSEGIAGGQYIWFENNYTNDDDSVLIANIYFNQGATYNAKRNNATTNGIIRFKDAVGVVSGYFFELDDLVAVTGSIVWQYTDPILIWKGGNISGPDTDGTRWDNANNWQDQSSGPGVPSASTKVFIYDVSAGSNKYPVLNDGLDVTIRSLTIYSGASLTIGGNKNFTVTKDLIFTGTLQVSSGSASTIYVGGQFSNGGVFTHGGASTLIWATTDNNTITSNNSDFYNLTLNSGGDGSGSAIFTTGSSLTVLGNFSLVAGTLTVANAAHQLAIKGNFSNQGTFNHGNGTVLLDGSTAQNISSTTALKFYNLQNNGTGAKNLLSDIEIQGKLTNNSAFNAGSYNILIKGDWAGNGTFSGGAGNVVFCGAVSQRITKNETFTNLVINNTAATNPISLNGIVTVTGQLTLTDGLITTSTSKYLQMNATATLTGGSANCYVNGLIRKVGSSDFLFPIGSSDQYAPLEITSLGTSSDFSAQYFDVAPTNRTNLQVGLNAVSNAEYWNLTRNSGTSTPRVSLYWYNNIFSGIDDLDVLSVARYNSTTSKWENYGVSSVIATPDHSTGHAISNLTFSQFGKITFGFVYPTISWIPTNGSASFTDNTNWTGTVVPTEQANITIPNIGAGTYPIVSSISQKTYNVTIEDGGVLAIADNFNLDVYGTFTLANTGRLILGTNSSINVYQDFTSTGSITCGTTSTVKFSGSTTQNIVLDTCYNTIFNGSGTKNLSSDIVVLGSVNTTNNVNAGSHTITVFGNWTTSGTFNAGTSTVILKGTGTQTITEPSAGGFYNLVINNSSATVPQISLGGNVLVNGLLTLTDGIVNSTSTRMLRVGNTGTASTGSDTSYVQGVLYKYGITDFVFPIGTNSILARIGISSMTGSGNFSASYFANPHTDLTHKVIGLDRVSGIEYWDLSRPSGTATPYVTLHWTDSSRSQIQNHSQLRVSHYTSGSWQNMGNSASTINADSSGFVQSSVRFTTFSPVTLGSGDASNPLPIELISFDAVQLNSNVLLTWHTLTETDNRNFTIERSSDNKLYKPIFQIDGAGTSRVENHYQFVDKYVSSGVYYYRLKQTDYNGQSNDCGKVVSVNVSNQFESTLTVYPNPSVNSNINISYSDRENLPIEIKIIDMLGKTQFIKEYQLSNGYLETNLENECNLMPGTYYMILSNSQKIQQVQFSIAHN